MDKKGGNTDIILDPTTATTATTITTTFFSLDTALDWVDGFQTAMYYI